MTDTANAPERIKAWMQPYFSEIGSWSTTRYPEVTIEYVLATHCDELVAAARAEGAREAQAKIERMTEALKDAVEIVHKSYVLATMEAVNAGPASPIAASHDAWRAKCVRVEESARAALQENANE